MRYISMMLAALMIFCGCQNTYKQTKDIMQQMPPESSSHAVEQTNDESSNITEIEVTQPPCLACEDEVEINPVTEQIEVISEEEKKEQLYASNAPAKQSWLLAYKSFYSMTVDLSQEDMDVISSNSPYKRAINNLELRSDMGIEFSYPIREMLFAHVDTIASNGSTSEIALKCALNGGMGMLVNYKDDSTFAGEIVFGKDDIFENEIIYNADSPPQFTPFEQGNYINRTSLTITEGIEAQLLDFGFAPETTLALALRLSDDEYGICFHDDEKAAYYNNVTKHGKSLDQKLYSFEELRDALCEVYDVCSIEEIDALYASTVESESDGINIGQTAANPVTAKPVIYLYPERETEVSVKLGYPAEYLTYTYPEYNGGWQVIAYPDGRMINKSDGSEHYYLFWEGDKKIDWDMSEGFIVRGSEITQFLREKLIFMGLTPREYNDFITYWAPEMSQNEYNLVSFSWKQYEELAPLVITPKPDKIFRVHMVYKAIDVPVAITEQQLPVFERNGFSVLEWGGSCA